MPAESEPTPSSERAEQSSAISGVAVSDLPLLSRDLSCYYGKHHAVDSVTLEFHENSVTALIGPSGCGKSTYLRSLNRMHELIPNAYNTGEAVLRGTNIFERGADPVAIRRAIGMVFQRPNPFPLSVFDNIAYGRRVHGMTSRAELQAAVESSLRATLLWDDLKDKLDVPALELSPERQQRLCISRLLAIEPEVLLMDEPCSALDPISTGHIEELMGILARDYTIVIVTHNMQQASRVSLDTAFMLLGELVESGPTRRIFTNPAEKRTEDYITGRFG
jgi:phosphate transport system ATP-binding protein